VSHQVQRRLQPLKRQNQLGVPTSAPSPWRLTNVSLMRAGDASLAVARPSEGGERMSSGLATENLSPAEPAVMDGGLQSR